MHATVEFIKANMMEKTNDLNPEMININFRPNISDKNTGRIDPKAMPYKIEADNNPRRLELS